MGYHDLLSTKKNEDEFQTIRLIKISEVSTQVGIKVKVNLGSFLTVHDRKEEETASALRRL